MKKLLKTKGYFLFFVCLFLLMATKSEARLRIPFGSRDVVNVIYTTPEKDSIFIDDNKVDFACYHKEYNIAYFFPLYIEQEPELVLYDKKNDMIYAPETAQQKQFIKDYLKKKGINEEEALNIGWYTRWGGKVVFILLIVLVGAGSLMGKKQEIKEPTKL